MKTDKFDEEFRRKIENFHPPFNDTEIDRIQGYIGQHLPLSFWQRFGHVFTYSVGALIIVTLLTTTLYKTYENKTLLKQLSVLNTQLEQAKADSSAAVIVSNKIISTKTDTVFITKYIPIKVDNEKESLTITSSENSFSKASQTNVNAPIKENTITNQNIDNEEITTTIKENNTEKSVSEINEKASSIKESTTKNKLPIYNKKVKNQDLASLKSTKINDPSIVVTDKNTVIPIVAELPVSSFSSVANEVANSQFNNTQLLHRNYHFIDNKAVFDLSKKDFIIPQIAQQVHQKKSFKLPSITLPNLKYRVGFGVEMADEYGGFNILTDILVSKRWSLTTGVGFSTFFDDEDFEDEDEFRKDTKKDFRKEYESRINDNTQINDIHINQALLKIPVYINYRLPLPKNFTVLLTTGSNLGIHSRQFVSYNHQNSFRDGYHQRFSLKVDTPIFNNLLFSVGIEKRWQKYSVQLSPYFITQLKQISYQEENWQLGLKLNGFYRLSK